MSKEKNIYFETYKSISKKQINVEDVTRIMSRLDLLSISKEVNEKENSILYSFENDQQIKLQRYEGKIDLLYNCDQEIMGKLEGTLEDE